LETIAVISPFEYLTVEASKWPKVSSLHPVNASRNL
jgi:hypothetical protein